MEKMYGVKIERANLEKKIGNRIEIKPIRQLTQNVLYWENQEITVGNLYKDIYEATKPKIIAELNMMNSLELFKLAQESEEENNLLLCDICLGIINGRFDELKIKTILDFLINKDIGITNHHNRCISFVQKTLYRKMKELDTDELNNMKQYFYDMQSQSIKEYAGFGHYRLSMDDYAEIKDKSIEEKSKLLTKVEKIEKTAQHKLFQHYFYKRIYEYANEISIEKSKKTL